MMSRKYSVILASWCILSSTVVAQEESLPLAGTVTTHLRLGDRRFPIHPMASNVKVPPEQWQFRYLPLLLPEIDQAGNLIVNIEQTGDAWVVSVRIWLDTLQAQAAAFQSVRASYPAEANRVLEANIGSVPVSEMRFTVAHPRERVITDPFNPGAQPAVTVIVPAKDQHEAELIQSWMRSNQGRLRCEYTFGTRRLRENSARVTMNHLRNSSLVQKLDGLPKDNGLVYVHRDQLQQLTDGVHRQLDGDYWIEDPEQFDDSVVDGLIALWNEQVEIDATKWSEANQRIIFNAQDLAPDVIERELNNFFTYNEGKYKQKLDVGGGVGGGVSIGPISIFGNAEGSYSKEEFESFLKQHSVEVEWDGERIVVKKIWLQVVNTGDFSGDATVSFRRLYDQGKEMKTETVDIQLGESIRGGAVKLDVAGQLAELSRQLEDHNDTINRRLEHLLGPPESMSPNQEFVTESDGFIVVFISGPEPTARGYIMEIDGVVVGQLDGRQVKVQATGMWPVRKGSKWKLTTLDVNAKRGTPGVTLGTAVRFIPIAPSAE